MKVKTQAELCISGALKTTPSAVLDILLNFPSLHILEKKAVKNSALRLRAYDMCKSNNFGHSNIIPVNHINTKLLSTFRRKKTSRLKFQLAMIGVTSTKICKSGQIYILTDRSSIAELVLPFNV